MVILLNLFFKMKLYVYKYINNSLILEYYLSYIEYKCKIRKCCGEEKEWFVILSRILIFYKKL